MSALAHLASLLMPGTQEGARGMTAAKGIDAVIATLERQAKAGASPRFAEDLQLEAVRRFWQTQEVSSFRDAYLLSWGLCLPHRPGGECVLDDRPRLERVLAGADDWAKKPTAYRRCYQGLVKSYFSYSSGPSSDKDGRINNWRLLRDYLHERNGTIIDTRTTPDWVGTALDNKILFTAEPYSQYVDALLYGDSSVVDVLCRDLHIGKASWFLKRLVMAQVKRAVQMSDSEFVGLMSRLLRVLAENEVLRDLGLTKLLDRYVVLQSPAIHKQLQKLTVNWWGNPWLPSNATRWGGVTPEARAMVSDWLKSEIIETFFTKLAEDGSADPRRMDFWKRYVKSIDHMEFALGSTARNSTEPDFVALRKKMTGLTCHLETSGANNAFIMKMGHLVVVEFSGMGNALYGYDTRNGLPFDTTKVLRLPTGANNSLKQKSRSVLWESHKDSAGSWSTWEKNFEMILLRDFGIQPQPEVRPIQKRERQVSPPSMGSQTNGGIPKMAGRLYSLEALAMLSKQIGCEVHDKTPLGGSLWVRTDAANEDVTRLLTSWGFSHKPGKGWWK